MKVLNTIKKLGVMWGKVVNFFRDPFCIDHVIKQMGVHTDVLKESIQSNYDKTVELSDRISKLDRLYDEYRFNALVSKAFEECTPDMYWAKDIFGKYVIANKAVREGLLFDDKPYGKTDLELAAIQKELTGPENFTFGIVCGDSDYKVLENKHPMRFIEWGKVNGKMLILEVHKNVMTDDDGNIVGTVGIGRDITEDYEMLHRIADATTCDATKSELINYLEKYTFENKDIHE